MSDDPRFDGAQFAWGLMEVLGQSTAVSDLNDLVYAQHTANLIAWYRLNDGNADLAVQIEERMGLA